MVKKNMVRIHLNFPKKKAGGSPLEGDAARSRSEERGS